MTRQRNSKTGTKPCYKWCGFGFLRVPETFALTTPPEVISLCPRMLSDDAQGDVTLEAIYAHIAIRRLLTTSFDALGYFIATQKADIASGDPIEVLDAIPSGGGSQAELGNRDILMQGLLPVPPRVFNGFDGSAAISSEIKVAEVHYKARRGLHRLTHGVFMHLNTDVSDVCSVFVSGRLLLRYS